MSNKIEFGTGSAFGYLKKEKAIKIIDYAVGNGITKFDTGANYGQWKSQPLLGYCLERYLKKNRDSYSISTKAGTHSEGRKNTKNFKPEYIKNVILKSLEDLKSGYIDIFYLHGPTERDLNNPELLRTLYDLKKKKLIRHIGISTHELTFMKKIASGFYSEIDTLLIDYNLIQQDRSVIFKICNKNNIVINAGTVLCQGLLISNPFSIFLNNRNLFYAARFLFNGSTKRLSRNCEMARKFMKKHYPNNYSKIPLSYVASNPNIKSIPIGMLSKKSIKTNTQILNNLPSKKDINLVSSWCLKNCQIKDL